MPNAKRPTCVLFLRDLSITIKEGFKGLCAQQSVDMVAAVEQLMLEATEQRRDFTPLRSTMRRRRNRLNNAKF